MIKTPRLMQESSREAHCVPADTSTPPDGVQCKARLSTVPCSGSCNDIPRHEHSREAGQARARAGSLPMRSVIWLVSRLQS